MKNNEFEENRVVARLSKVLPVLLLPALLLVFLLCGLSRRTQAGPTRPTGVNLVPNPGFETPSPAYWEDGGSSSPFCGRNWVGDISHSGDHSVRIWGSASFCTGWWRCDHFTVSAGLPYTFSGWIKTNNLSDEAFLTLAFYTSTSSVDPIAEYTSSQVIGSSDWITATGSAIAPTGVYSARVYCKLSGTGTAWFDDIDARAIPTVTPILVIDKSGAPDPVEPGQSLVYTITYSNTGNGDATQVVITETYDVNVESDAADPPPNRDDRVWEVGTLGSHDSDFIVITVTVSNSLTDGLILWNRVEMGCSETDSVTDAITTTIDNPPPPDLYLPLVLKNFDPFCNGGFKTGDFTCWTHGGDLDQSVQSEIVYEGNYAALLGNPGYKCRNGVPIGEAAMTQTFSVPSCPDPVLSFKYRIFSNDVLSDIKYDSFDVYVNDTLVLRDGNTDTDWEQADCDREPWDSGWKGFSYGLSAYKGQNIQVSFHDVNRVDRYYNTWTYVDQVEVICQP